MYTNRKRSENDQYNETSRHIQMKGGGGGGAGTPGDAGGPPGRRRTLSFVLIVFTSFFICIPFILCFQCVFDLYFFLFVWILFLRVASALRGLLKNGYWFYVFSKCKNVKTRKHWRFLKRRALIVRNFWAIYLWKRLNGWSIFIKILKIKIAVKLKKWIFHAMFCCISGAEKMRTDRAHLLDTGLWVIALSFDR